MRARQFVASRTLRYDRCAFPAERLNGLKNQRAARNWDACQEKEFDETERESERDARRDAYTRCREIFREIADATSASGKTCNWFAVSRRLNFGTLARPLVFTCITPETDVNTQLAQFD